MLKNMREFSLYEKIEYLHLTVGPDLTRLLNLNVGVLKAYPEEALDPLFNAVFRVMMIYQDNRRILLEFLVTPSQHLDALSPREIPALFGRGGLYYSDRMSLAIVEFVEHQQLRGRYPLRAADLADQALALYPPSDSPSLDVRDMVVGLSGFGGLGGLLGNQGSLFAGALLGLDSTDLPTLTDADCPPAVRVRLRLAYLVARTLGGISDNNPTFIKAFLSCHHPALDGRSLLELIADTPDPTTIIGKAIGLTNQIVVLHARGHIRLAGAGSSTYYSAKESGPKIETQRHFLETRLEELYSTRSG